MYAVVGCITFGYLFRDAYEDDGSPLPCLILAAIMGAIWPATLFMMLGWQIRKCV